MQKEIRKEEVQNLLGKHVYAVKNDGTVVEGKLLRVSNSHLFIAPKKDKKARTSALMPLVLFDLLAIGTAPYAYGPYGYGGGFGYGGYGGYGYGSPYGGGFFI